MEIIVEIGTSEQQEQIKKELAVFTDVLNFADPPLNIGKVIIASDFDAQVNKLQGTTTYESVRGVMAVAKVINVGDSVAVVLSSYLYTEKQDTQTRFFIFLHEIVHASNKQKFPSIASASYSSQTYLINLYTLFDEYIADRTAFIIIDRLFPSKSEHWMNFIQEDAPQFATLINDTQNYTKIKSEIESFRIHGNVNTFLKNIRPRFDDVALSIVHAFALADHNPDIMQLLDIAQSPFINERTLALMRFLSDKYRDHIFDVHDGIAFIANFMENFGMRFEDTPEGCYCHVLDI